MCLTIDHLYFKFYHNIYTVYNTIYNTEWSKRNRTNHFSLKNKRMNTFPINASLLQFKIRTSSFHAFGERLLKKLLEGWIIAIFLLSSKKASNKNQSTCSDFIPDIHKLVRFSFCLILYNILNNCIRIHNSI